MASTSLFRYFLELTLFFLVSNCAAAFARLMTSMLVLGEYDVMWVYSRAVMWSIIELSTGIVCACLPTMRVVFKAIFSKRVARALGLGSGSGGTSRPKSDSTPWRSNNYNEIHSVGTAKASSLNTQDAEPFAMGAQGIRVDEEFKIEMQPITQTAPRGPG